MDFYMKFWKPEEQEFLFFALISSGSVPEVFEAQNHISFSIGSLYAATFNTISVYAFIDRSMWTKKDFLMLPINLNISLGGIKYVVA